MYKIINVVGARPNFMKIAPLQELMQQYNNFNPILLHTGQHYDKRMSQIFFDELSLPKPDIYLGIGSGTHTWQTANVMLKFEEIIVREKPDLVLVVGDVNSTLACSLVATKLHIPVAHIEAGLRSFDRTMPEEINRQITDLLSDYLFTTSPEAEKNLINEGIDKDKIYYVGNVMIDTLNKFRECASSVSLPSNVHFDKYALLTLHRPSNVDDKDTLNSILDALDYIQKHLPIVFPIHPRTRKMFKTFNLEKRVNQMSNLILTEPLGYLQFIKLMMNAQLVLTDSGGIQEETTVLGVPCLTLRNNTERPITITSGTNILVGMESKAIIHQADIILNGDSKKGQIPPLWDGKAAIRIIEILNTQLSNYR